MTEVITARNQIYYDKLPVIDCLKFEKVLKKAIF